MTSLSSALNASLSGLRASQAGIDLASRNIANAATPGYSAKSRELANLVLDGRGRGVVTDAVQRDVDRLMTEKTRGAASEGARLRAIADTTQRLDSLFGAPEDESSVAARVQRLETALQDLATAPENSAARQGAADAADRVARGLNADSREIQAMRTEAERGIADAAERLNADLARIADLNNEIAQRKGQGLSTADLADARDRALGRVAEEIEIRTVSDGDGRTLVFTPDGTTLAGRSAAEITFDGRARLTPETAWSPDAGARGVGTLTLSNGGMEIDLIRSGALSGGRIAGLVELRDRILPQAQAQLDEVAHQLALAFATHAQDAVKTGGGLEIDLDGLVDAPGDRITVAYETGGGAERTLTLIASRTQSGPADGTLTATPNDGVAFFQLGADADATAVNVAAQIDALTAGQLDGAAVSGSTLRIEAATGAPRAAEATVVLTGQQSADPDRLGLALFADSSAGQTPYTASLDGGGAKTGFAGRIALADGVAADPSVLVKPTPDSPAGAGARIQDLTARLGERTRTFSPAAGIGSADAPAETTIAGFARDVVAFQGAQAARRADDAGGAARAADSLKQRLSETTGVSIDQEMSRLLELEKMYQANARLMTVVDELFDQLFAIAR